MRQLGLFLSITIFAVLVAAVAAVATAETTVETVRRMCTAPDNQDFSVFDQELLPDILIEIIEDDPLDAEYHERVVSSALKTLGALHVPEAVGVLVSEVEEYPTTCLYWLGSYDSPEAVATILEYLDDEDASLRCEAVEALGRLPAPDDETEEEYAEYIYIAFDRIAERASIEEDGSVIDALREASVHIARLLLEIDSEGTS